MSDVIAWVILAILFVGFLAAVGTDSWNNYADNRFLPCVLRGAAVTFTIIILLGSIGWAFWQVIT